MKCSKCETEVTNHSGEWQTLVGYWGHDDNCLSREYVCPCGHRWVESLLRSCDRCDWTGKDECFCHGGQKVTRWSDEPRNEDKYRHHAGCPNSPAAGAQA